MRRFAASAVLVIALSALTPAAALPAIRAGAFEPASDCSCHGWLVGGWSRSLHAQALSDPLYQTKLAEADKATNGLLGPFCNRCHGPIGVMNGTLAHADRSKLSSAAADAVACDFCHQVTGTTRPLGNASQVLVADGTKRAQLARSVSAAHASAESGFHTTGEFCGACHNVDHPINGMHLEATYTEWKASEYARKGITCQDCHMSQGAGRVGPRSGHAGAGGPTRPDIFDMTFIGANSALGQAIESEALLQAAATMEMAVPEIAEGGSEQAVEVTIHNVGAGHYLPTGLTEVREMWLEVVATDPAGATVMNERRMFQTVLKDATGKHPVELWDATGVFSDDRIPPNASADTAFTLRMPTAGPVHVKAALYYRSASEEFATKAGVEVPTVTMALSEADVFTSDAERKGHASVQAALAAEKVSSGDGMLLGMVLVGLAIPTGLVIWGARGMR